jgi:hypothetical protein
MNTYLILLKKHYRMISLAGAESFVVDGLPVAASTKRFFCVRTFV